MKRKQRTDSKKNKTEEKINKLISLINFNRIVDNAYDTLKNYERITKTEMSWLYSPDKTRFKLGCYVLSRVIEDKYKSLPNYGIVRNGIIQRALLHMISVIDIDNTQDSVYTTFIDMLDLYVVLSRKQNKDKYIALFNKLTHGMYDIDTQKKKFIGQYNKEPDFLDRLQMKYLLDNDISLSDKVYDELVKRFDKEYNIIEIQCVY